MAKLTAAQRTQIAWQNGFDCLAIRLNTVLARFQPPLIIECGKPPEPSTIVKAAKKLTYWLESSTCPHSQASPEFTRGHSGSSTAEIINSC